MSRDRLAPLQFFHSTRARPCPYLPGRQERSIAAELEGHNVQSTYDAACTAGFRRSHGFIYRPACTGCDACVPVRIIARDFTPTRSMTRVLKRNADIKATLLPAQATLEQYALFAHYQRMRHASSDGSKEGDLAGRSSQGGMDRMTQTDYAAMIEESPVATRIIEHRQPDHTLVGVVLADFVADGLSAVYSFFAPELARRSLGSYMILDLVTRARQERLPHVYLGYWIAATPKMAYKTRFRPLESLGPHGWAPLT